MSHHNHDHYDGLAPIDPSHADHDHGEGGEDPDSSFGVLYAKIDVGNASVLNSENKAADAIKPWHLRLDNENAIESDADDQLIIRVPFTGSVKLKSVLLRTGPEGQTPTKIALFSNGDQLDFDDASTAKPDQEFDIVQSNDVGEYAVKPARFASIRSITIFIPSSQGGDTTRISYIGFKGEFTELKEQPIIALYEAQANPADHEKIQGTESSLSRPGM